MINLEEMSLMDQVSFTNNTFNKPPLDKNSPDYWAALMQQGCLVEEEFLELEKGLENGDLREVRDGICDVLVVGLGVAHLAGFKVSALPAPVEGTHPSLVNLDPSALIATNQLKFQISLLLKAIDRKAYFSTKEIVVEIVSLALKIGAAIGMDVAKDMAEVTKSNLSKVCPSLEDAVQTQHYYFDKKGVFTKLSPCSTFPGFIVLVDGTVTGKDGAVYPHRKFLKSIGFYKKPEFK